MKITRHVFTFVLLALMLSGSNIVSACPPGSVPIHGQGRCGSPSEATAAVNAANAASRLPAPPREVWQNKYGAIAADWSDNGGVGIAEDENSMRAARRVALQRCGTPRCKIVATATNGCLAGVHGIGGSAVGGGNTREEAISVAMNQCAPGAQCELRYAHCSLPVRIR